MRSLRGIGIAVGWMEAGVCMQGEAAKTSICDFTMQDIDGKNVSLSSFKGKVLLLALAIAIALQVTVIHLPFLHLPFNTVPMDGHEWIIAITLGVGVFLTETLRKLIAPRLFSQGKWQPVRWPTNPGPNRAKPSGDPSP